MPAEVPRTGAEETEDLARARADFQRWSDLRIEQMGQASSVLLLIATAIVGLGTWPTNDLSLDWRTGFRLVAVALAAASIFFGAALQHNRLRDFLITAAIARRRLSRLLILHGQEPLRRDSGKTAPELRAENALDRTRTDSLGEHTWDLYRGQLWTVVLAMAVLASGWYFALLTA